jgi:Xaa-Pro aminopeptidase
MTRTVCLGASSGRERALYQVVLEAQQRAIEAVRAGVSCSSVDAAARKDIARRGYARQFPHSTGHGLGLEVHEAPRIAASEKSILPAGAVITIEPGVYVPGFGGVRIEDVVVVRERGAQVLTSTPKAFVKIG